MRRVKLATGDPPSRRLRHHDNQEKIEREREEEMWEEEEQGVVNIIPGLPDHIACLCLSKLHPSLLYSVCSAWRRLVYSPLFPPFLSLYFLGGPSLNSIIHRQTNRNNPITTPIQLMNFDPISSGWISVPPPPDHPPLRLLMRHPSFLSRNLPIQSVAVNNHLVLLAATTDQLLPALPRPIIFSPLAKIWSQGPPIAVPRRWGAVGVLGRAVFLASGIGSHFSPDVAQSAERWELKSRVAGASAAENGGWWGKWEKVGSLKDGRFCREAIDAVGWRGKICMVNVKGDAAKEGVVYDVGRDAWEEMPEGMKVGWRGPAAAMEEEVIYVVDEKKGALRRYDEESDGWVDVLQDERLRKAQHIAAAGGRVCVVCGGHSGGVLVVDVQASPPRLWVVDTPPGFEAISVHILPRMNR
ncbi:hypothetical protein Ancab_033106 [Ancistrocladus abbreviatus]